jgi:NitT/TauT family transport system substrate-binding protein
MRALLVAAVIAAATAAGGSQLTSVDVSLGDVSINKVPQLVAADQGLYAKYGLDVHQTISAGAARAAAGSGVIVPKAYVNETPAAAAPIEVGGGSPMIHSVVNNGRPPRVIVLTQEAMAMDHVIAKPGIASMHDLKGRRLGFSGVGSVTHFSALSLARQFGWTPDRDITLVAGSATLDALKQDKVDAVLATNRFLRLADSIC